MRKYKIFILMAFSASIISSCGMKPRGWETEGMVAVLADPADWQKLQPELSRVFEKVTRTPQKEKAYTLVHVPDREFNRYSKYKYLILAASLESTGKIGRIVNKAISNPLIKNQIENNERFFIIRHNQWSHDQFMIILIGKTIDSLNDLMAANSEFLYESLDDVVTERMQEQMFKKDERKKLAQRLMSTYNWSINLQHDYFIPQEFSKEGFIWFRRILPERWIYVRWVNGGDKSLLNEQWVVGERNRVGAKYYGGDKIESKFLFSYKSEFLGRPAQITTGLWGNKDKMAGGPFKNYTFYDKFTKRVYMIDIAVHAPNRDKLPYLKRLDIIAQTFKTVFDMEIE